MAAATVAPSIVVTNCHVTRNAAAIGSPAAEALGSHRPAPTGRTISFSRAYVARRPAALGERESLQLGQAVAAIGFSSGTGRGSGSARAGAAFARRRRVIESDTAFTSARAAVFSMRLARWGSYVPYADRTAYFYCLRWIRDGLPTEDRGTTSMRGRCHSVHRARRGEPPYFMRAAPLSAEADGELIELTERWATADPRDAEPLRFRGEAMQTRSADAAVGAIKAVARPDAFGMVRFAPLRCHRKCRRLEQAGSRLADLDRDLAVQLNAAIARLGKSRETGHSIVSPSPLPSSSQLMACMAGTGADSDQFSVAENRLSLTITCEPGPAHDAGVHVRETGTPRIRRRCCTGSRRPSRPARQTGQGRVPHVDPQAGAGDIDGQCSP